jgi:hypothetical protein
MTREWPKLPGKYSQIIAGFPLPLAICFGSDNICPLIDMFGIIYFIYSDIYYFYCSSFFLYVPRFLLALSPSLWRITFNNCYIGSLPAILSFLYL